jgi:penicillin-binding protein 1A
VVWTGFDQQPNAAEAKSEPIAKLTGAGSALPIWIRFMKRALAGEPAAAFPTSTYLKTVRIDKHTGQLASDGCPDDSVLLEKYMIDHVPEQETCETMFPASTLESNL